MKVIETRHREIGFLLWGHCKNLLDDDPRMFGTSMCTTSVALVSLEKSSIFRN